MTALLQPLRYRVRRWTWALGVLLALSGAANALTTTGYVHPMQAHSLQGVAPTTEHCDTGDTGAINASADVAQDITSAAPVHGSDCCDTECQCPHALGAHAVVLPAFLASDFSPLDVSIDFPPLVAPASQHAAELLRPPI